MSVPASARPPPTPATQPAPPTHCRPGLQNKTRASASPWPRSLRPIEDRYGQLLQGHDGFLPPLPSGSAGELRAGAASWGPTPAAGPQPTPDPRTFTEVVRGVSDFKLKQIQSSLVRPSPAITDAVRSTSCSPLRTSPPRKAAHHSAYEIYAQGRSPPDEKRWIPVRAPYWWRKKQSPHRSASIRGDRPSQ
ncbi:hypothetical protein BS78_07G219900 [Paspalum vaginatum]|nr:hypothetical protein BS78_07G219900 [Paspalum vaginatum]